jgi:TonB family protein
MRLNAILSLAAGLSVALCAPSQLHAQQPGLQSGPKPNPLDPTKMPTDKLLAFAIAHNGAGEVPGEGWHLKGTFEYNISKIGDNRFVNGSFDETWYGPQNYSKTYEYKGVSHTDTATPDGLFRSGDQGWDTPEEVDVRRLLVSPLPTDPLDPNITLVVQEVPSGKATIPCLIEVYKMATGLSQKEQKDTIDHSPRLCFDPAAPILRFAAGIGSQQQVSFSKVTNLHGHLVAQEINVVAGDVPMLRIHVQEASVPPDPTGPMAVPAGAQKLISPVTVAWETISSTRIPNPRQPVFPAGALQEHLEGDVNIATVIAPDGTVTSAKIVDGVQMFREYALDFIKKSKFKPFMLSGTPVEVHTTAHIHFSMQMGIQQSRGTTGPDCTANPMASGCSSTGRMR